MRVVQDLKRASMERDRLINGSNGGSGLGSLFAALEWKAEEDPAAPAALTTLALMWESAAPGAELELLCDCIRTSCSVPRIIALVAHPATRTRQAALMLLGRLMDDANDRRAKDTRQLVKDTPAASAKIAQRLFDNTTLTVVHTLTIVKWLCKGGDLSQVRLFHECGAISRLRALTRCDEPTLASGAAACMELVMADVKGSSVSVRVVSAATRVAAVVRRRRARKQYETAVRAAIALQAMARAAGPLRELRAHQKQKADEAAQKEAEKEALIILRLRLSGPMRQRLKERAAAARRRVKEEMAKRIEEAEKARAAKAAAATAEVTEAERRRVELRAANMAKKEEEREAAARAIKEAKEAKARARKEEQEAAKQTEAEAKKLEDAKQQQQRDTAARREANLQSKGPSRELKALAEKPVTTPV